MNEIKIFSNELFGEIRTSVTETGDPLFCLADLCGSLNLSNTTVVAKRLDNDEVTKLNLGSMVGETNFVTESGLYSVILRSNSNRAKPMQKWVTSEVLPAIRKTGGYIVSKPEDTPEIIMARALIVAQDTIARAQQSLMIKDEQLALQERVIIESAPKVEYFEKVLTSTDTCLTNQIAKELGISAITLNERLRQKGIQYKQGGQWLLSAKYQGKGLTKTHTYPFMHRDGSTGTQMQTVWTEKGRLFIHQVMQSQLQPA